LLTFGDMQPQVCLYGVERFGVKADALEREHKGKRFSVLPLESDLQLKGLAQPPDLVIATANPMLAQTAGSATYEASNLQMLSNVRMALEQGVSCCLIENGAVRDTQVVGSAAQKSLGYKVLAEDFSIGFNPTELSNEFTKVNPYFDHFLKNHGFTSVGFIVPQTGAGEIDVIARLKKDGRAAAVARKQGRGMLIIVPAQPQTLELDFFADLADGCLNYIRAKTTDIPVYVEEFHFAEEQPIVKELEALNAQLLKIKKKFGDFTEKKDILGLDEVALHHRLPAWFEKYLELDIDASRNGDGPHFYLAQGGKRVAIGEIKSTAENVKREHLTKLRLRREEAELADDYPSVLIVNTFTGAESLANKDQRVESRECAKAGQDHIVILRTIDLLRVLDLPNNKQQEFKKLLLTAAGWLKVGAAGVDVVQS
jgi:hypothetical protein